MSNAIFNREKLTIEVNTGKGHSPYEVDLERCTNSAKMLDFIFQVAAKRWCTPEVLLDFIRAIEQACYEVHDKPVQATFCPNGIDQTVQW